MTDMRTFCLNTFMAVAVLAFVACTPQNQPDVNHSDPNQPQEVQFDIHTDSITPTSALIRLTPSDTAATYYWNVFEASCVAQKSQDSLRKAMEEDLQDAFMTHSLGVPLLSLADMLSKGEERYSYIGLSANAEYMVLAVQMSDKGVASGEVAKQPFKTLPAQADSTVTIAKQTGVLHDLRTQDGTFMITATEENLDISITVVSNTLVGDFRSADLDPKASYITDWNTYRSTDIIEAEFTGTLSTAAENSGKDSYLYEGWFLTEKKIKYIFRFLCSKP